MPWPFWSKPASTASNGAAKDKDTSSVASTSPLSPSNNTSREEQWWNLRTWQSKDTHSPISWNDTLNAIDWHHYWEPRNWIPPLLVAGTAIGALQFYRSYLRRIPGTAYIAPGAFRRKTLLGRVTSVGDGDNFHLFHTPGGRLAGWGWARKVPVGRTELKGRTIPVRIAGVDAPEGAHFGRPAQPYSAEALLWLQNYLLDRRVRCKIWRRDQYERVVASVYVRRGPGPLNILRRDVGLEMLRRGLATTYEAKTGAEFGGERMESKYKAAEEKAREKGIGMWAGEKSRWWGLRKPTGSPETPREYKTRMKEAEKGAANAEKAVKGVQTDVRKKA